MNVAGVSCAFALTLLGVNGQICNNPVYMRNYRWNTTAPVNVSCLNPETEDEIVAYVEYVTDTGNASIRGIGKSFSWSAVGMMETENYTTGESQEVYFVNQTEYRRNCTVDEGSMQMTCEAGVRVIDVCNELMAYNLSLPDFGGPMTVGFVGSFNSGTHGKGSRSNPIGNMARQVIEFKMVLANGSVITASENENHDIWQAGRISMGSLGIITEFTIQAQPFYNITRYRNINANFSNRIANFDAIEEYVCNDLRTLMNDTFFIYGGWQTFRHKFQWQNYYLETAENKQNKTCWNFTEEGFNKFPCSDAYFRAVSPFPTEAYTHGANNEAEFYVLEEDFEKAYLAGIYWVNSQRECNPCMWDISREWWYNRSNGTSNTGEIQVNTRWIGPDCQWLSPSYSDLCENGSSVAQIGIYMPGGYVPPTDPSDDDKRVPFDIWNFWVNGYYNAIKQAVSPNPVRVHWGKSSQTNYCEINESYPKMGAFRELRNQLDPNEIFTNQIVRDKLGVGCDYCCCTGYTCDLTNYRCPNVNLTCGVKTTFDCDATTTTEPTTTDSTMTTGSTNMNTDTTTMMTTEDDGVVINSVVNPVLIGLVVILGLVFSNNINV